MILVGVLRHYFSLLLNSSAPVAVDKLAQSNILLQSRTLRSNSSLILASSYLNRKSHLLNLLATTQNTTTVAITDPAGMEAMMEGMKKNMAMIIPQTLLMSLITYYFSGFVIIKLPFPLTLRFKSMLQSGINTTDMDVRWVSSLSWYFLNLFGLKSVYTLLLGNENSAGGVQDMQQMQMAGMMNQPGMQQADIQKIFDSEKEFLEISEHKFALAGIEVRLLEKYGKMIKKSSVEKKKE